MHDKFSIHYTLKKRKHYFKTINLNYSEQTVLLFGLPFNNGSELVQILYFVMVTSMSFLSFTRLNTMSACLPIKEHMNKTILEIKPLTKLNRK